MRAVDRQCWIVGGIVLLLGGLIFVGSQIRDRFAPVEVGTRAPNSQAVDLQGRTVSLTDLRGEVVFLNIRLPGVSHSGKKCLRSQRLYERLAPEGLRIVAVSIGAAPGRADAAQRPGGDVAAFAKEYGLTLGIWQDPAGEIQRIYRTTGYRNRSSSTPTV